MSEKRHLTPNAPIKELVRTARGLVRTAHAGDVGKHEVVREWWDVFVKALGAVDDQV